MRRGAAVTTPGPWELRSELVGCNLVVDGPGRSPVARLYAFDQPDKPDMEARANAHLVAAAPDLLTVAERLMDGAVDCASCGGSGHNPFFRHDDPHECVECAGYGEFFGAGATGEI